MKKGLCIFIVFGLLFTACGKDSEEKPEAPKEITKIKNNFSSLYQIMFRNQNKGIFPVLEENEAIMVGAGFGSEYQTTDISESIFDERKHYYMKQVLELMETAQIQLMEDHISDHIIMELDDISNRLAHELNEENYQGAMQVTNNGIYLIARLMDDYGFRKSGCVMRLEYCLNLLEIDAEHGEKFLQSVALTEQVLSELAGFADEKSSPKVLQMKLSIKSLKNAATYQDPQLIRQKVEIMRSNWKKISSMAEE